MTNERAAALAASLQIGLRSPGVCPACIRRERDLVFRSVVRGLAAALAEEVSRSRAASMN